VSGRSRHRAVQRGRAGAERGEADAARKASAVAGPALLQPHYSGASDRGLGARPGATNGRSLLLLIRSLLLRSLLLLIRSLLLLQ